MLDKKINEILIKIEDAQSTISQRLMAHLTEELAKFSGEEGVNNFSLGDFSLSDLHVPGSAFVVAWLSGEPVGCGVVRPVLPGIAEIKRMFVERYARGHGVARAILEQLESLAREAGYGMVQLQASIQHTEAISLYEAAGYERVPCFGSIVQGRSEGSQHVCFVKQLTK